MASPIPVAPTGTWGGNSQARPTPPPQSTASGPDEYGILVKTMGLKVTYTLADDGESFLARHHQLLPIQTIQIDETSVIGMVDLKICAQAVVRCSPELLADATRDFAVYAYDYSEPDQPLVGQGFLGWIMNAAVDKKIIGRATRNPLSFFSSGVKDILEIKFKLKPVAAMAQPQYGPAPTQDLRPAYDGHASVEPQHPRPAAAPLTPSSYAEWNSLMQSNPQMGNLHRPVRVASPPSSHHQNDFQQPQLQRGNSFGYNVPPPQPSQQQPQQQQQQQQQQQPRPHSHPLVQNSEGPNRITPTLVDTATETQTNPPSRPSSRASNRSRKSTPTGRPRGRPRKQPRAESQGNTSGYEDGTDGDEGPAKKKRATTTQISGNINTPFGSGPEVLRVAASTSGSLRTLRPMGLPVEAPIGSHIQEVPRAPTPVPDKGPKKPHGKGAKGSKLRRQSTLSQAATPPSQPCPEVTFAMSPSQQDGRSPVDSEAASPLYSDSPAPIGSSPPVPRTARFVRSSPPASSPILPPMPMPQHDSGFMSGGADDVFEHDGMKQLPPPSVVPTAPPRPNITKERRSRSGIPIQVFQLATQPSSEAELSAIQCMQPAVSRPPTSIPTQEPPLPSLQRAVSDSRISMPPPPSQPSGKEQTPQQEEPAVAMKPDVDDDAQCAPTPEVDTTYDGLDSGLEYGLEQLAQAVNALPGPVMLEPSLTEPPMAGPAAEESFARPCVPPSLQHSASSGFHLALPTVPASDPVNPLALPNLPLQDATSFSEAPCPPSDALHPPGSPQQLSRTNKNYVKKRAIREKLLQAIENGQTPMYCTNCGAIETPTWRKIWTQEHEGVPEFTEFSDKPGRVTAILVLDRDEDEKPTRYQVIKKNLLPGEKNSNWKEHMLCNPCGIWLSKWKSHRPSEKWEKDRSRLGQPRRPRGTGRAPRPPRAKKSTSQLNPTSEAYFTTDPAGPDDATMDESRSRGVSQISNANETSEQSSLEQLHDSRPASPGNASNPGSTHSRGSGTAKSPINVENSEVQNMGATRRLLFPSPRKEGIAKVLGELVVNTVQTAPLEPSRSIVGDPHKAGADKDASNGTGTNKENFAIPDDDLEALFRSPAIVRPSTPPPRGAANGPFKTPTRPTPNHRPITRSVTRSVSRSLRSGDLFRSPAGVRRTPTRTPRSIRRSPRLHHDEFAQMEIAMEEYLQTQPLEHTQYDSDVLEAMNRALAESMNQPGTTFDVSGMVLVDSSCHMEFGDLLDTPARSSPRARTETASERDWNTWEHEMRVRHAALDSQRT